MDFQQITLTDDNKTKFESINQCKWMLQYLIKVLISFDGHGLT